MEAADAGNAMEYRKAVTGTVFGVGVGPGDPELITLKAARLIRSASVVAYPVQRGASLARSIAAEMIADHVIEIAIDTPMGEKGLAQPGYQRAVAAMHPHLEAGRDIVVLCEGDPLFYGSFMYVMEAVGGLAPVEVVPGVSSLTACAAVARWPLVGRNERISVLSAPSDDAVLRQGLEHAETAAIFKVGKHLGRVRALLAEMGLLASTLYVERATQENQSVCPLCDVPETASAYFAVLLVRCA